MTYWDKKLIREQLDKKIKAQFLTGYSDISWIKAIREALGMSTQQLAKRVGIDQSRISRLENSEIEGDLKLSSLKKIADGLNMRFVYGFVPTTSLEEMVWDQARKIALKRMGRVNHTMRLEEQELNDEAKANSLNDLIHKILIENPKDFWNQ
ncbi:mobile mystery protein A [Spirosoma daeguense]